MVYFSCVILVEYLRFYCFVISFYIGFIPFLNCFSSLITPSSFFSQLVLSVKLSIFLSVLLVVYIGFYFFCNFFNCELILFSNLFFFLRSRLVLGLHTDFTANEEAATAPCRTAIETAFEFIFYQLGILESSIFLCVLLVFHVRFYCFDKLFLSEISFSSAIYAIL